MRGCCSSTAFVEQQKKVELCSHHAPATPDAWASAGQQLWETGESFGKPGNKQWSQFGLSPCVYVLRDFWSILAMRLYRPIFFRCQRKTSKPLGRIHAPFCTTKKHPYKGPRRCHRWGERGWGGDRDGDDCMSGRRDGDPRSQRSQAQGGESLSPGSKGSVLTAQRAIDSQCERRGRSGGIFFECYLSPPIGRFSPASPRDEDPVRRRSWPANPF